MWFYIKADALVETVYLNATDSLRYADHLINATLAVAGFETEYDHSSATKRFRYEPWFHW